MPGNLLRQKLDGQEVDFYLLSDLAREFGVSLEAMCIRFVKYTMLRAVLIHWDNGFMKYQWCSQSAIQSNVTVRNLGHLQVPPPDTLAAEEEIVQEWSGLDLSANVWCPSEPVDAKLREMKHTYAKANRVLTLLILEPPRGVSG
jgi:hypothetical protein